jgi:hypothetical protein
MGRILPFLLILVLAFSHGPMSAGVPHFDGTSHEHVSVVDHHDTHAVADAGDDHADEALSDVSDTDTSKAQHGLGHHVHVVTDGVPSAAIALLDRRYKKDRLLPVDDARLRSTALAPLPEPPSA